MSIYMKVLKLKCFYSSKMIEIPSIILQYDFFYRNPFRGLVTKYVKEY